MISKNENTNDNPKTKFRDVDYLWQHPEIVIIILILAFLIGLILSLPFKILKEKESRSYILGPRQDLINQILALSEEKDELKDALMKEREQLGSLEQSLGKKEKEGKLLLQRFRDASLLAGVRAVSGKGIILRLEESDDNIPSGEEIAPYLIHHEDLLNITNELWAAGAEAMAIRSHETIERIVVSTAIRCAGPVVNINNQPMSPPFEILAIGDPKGLRQALEGPGRVLQPLEFFRISYSIEESESITLPPYSGAIITRFTQPADDSADGGDGQ